MLSDPALYSKFQGGCRAVTDELSWTRLTAKMDGYYAQVIERTPAQMAAM